MTIGQRLARAALLFHRGGPWTAEDAAHWFELTGNAEVTTRALCDLARETEKAAWFLAFMAATPNGTVLRRTLRSDPDEAWCILRSSVTDPDTLHENGWRLRRVTCFPEDLE